jgi:hypothetical protein
VPASVDFFGANQRNEIKKNTFFKKQSGEVAENKRSGPENKAEQTGNKPERIQNTNAKTSSLLSVPDSPVLCSHYSNVLPRTSLFGESSSQPA